MENQITKKFMDILGPITDGRLHFGNEEQAPVATGHHVVALTDKQKQQVEQLIKEHYLVEGVEWINHVGGAGMPGKAVITKTHKLVDEDYETYEGKTAYMYQILFSPKMYDPTTWVKEPVKDGCTFGPLWYDPQTFEPRRQIVLTFNPTFPQDLENKEDQEEVMKQTLRDKLEQVLTNPKDYMPKGFRACMLRFAAK